MIITLNYSKKLIKNEEGFTLAVSLIILLVLIAASTIVFIVTHKDLLISSRIQAEKKAFANAETALSIARLEFKKKGGDRDKISLTNKPEYSFHHPPLAGAPVGVPTSRSLSGYAMGTWGEDITLLTVQGRSGSATVIIDAGIGYAPVPAGSTGYR